MNLPTGVSLFELLEQHSDSPYMPRSYNDLAAFEQNAKDKGFDDLAEYIHSWIIFLDYHIKAEWKNVKKS